MEAVLDADTDHDAMFPLTAVYYPDMQDTMSNFEAMSVMSEPPTDDIDGEEEESGAENEVERDDYPWGAVLLFEWVSRDCGGGRRGDRTSGVGVWKYLLVGKGFKVTRCKRVE